MEPTLTMRHRPTSETLVVECDHGVTTGDGDNIVTSDQLHAALVALVARRECSCQPTVMVEEWPSLAEAIDLHPDEERSEFGDVVVGQYAAVRQLLLASLCSGCDPSVSAVISRGALGQLFTVRHEAACPIAPAAAITTIVPLDWGAPS